MQRKKELIFLLILIGFGLLATWPLFRPGFLPTHDGEYHLIRFWQFEQMLSNGYWFPRWAPDLNSGYGVPIFNFHYPLPNYLGVFFHWLGFSFADSFKLILAFGYLGGMITGYIWLRYFFRPFAALCGSILMAFVPYWFLDIYVRGSVGEVLAMPLVFSTLIAIERRTMIGFAIGVGLLILTHNIMALLFLPVIGLYLLYRQKILWPGLLWGISLSAYFWLPAILERSYVVGLNSVNYRDYFPQLHELLIPSWGTGFSAGDAGNRMSTQIGIVPLLVLIGSPFAVIRSYHSPEKLLGLLFLLISYVSIFLILPVSRVIWEAVPMLQFAQYPWRLLSLIILPVGFLGAYSIDRVLPRGFGVLLVILAIALTYSYTRPAIYEPRNDDYYLSRSNFTDGTSSLGNSFSTVWSPWKQRRPEAKIEIVGGEGSLGPVNMSGLRYTFSLRAQTPMIVRVNMLYYPGWRVFVDRIDTPIQYQDEGIITFAASPGDHHIRVFFTETSARKFADAVTFISLFWLLGSFILKGTYARY